MGALMSAEAESLRGAARGWRSNELAKQPQQIQGPEVDTRTSTMASAI
ncbi:hypothetical protein MTP10_18575 [Nonomuraea sp. 3-1Str]|nr:hypothetical protein [Nonomuraea sp. 3-1Str]MDR8410734.1 hypothetical protein [Nonomuraea sp. 3-1Str]